ncbi:MAG: hypothetical protein OXK77_15090 [Gemmatimonadota bacterium]|nr:hypothetical protein [Gemmatimonadota bacterium]MDE2865969.1 hypothetical protein [Gemmatimonadota bacterium]
MPERQFVFDPRMLITGPFHPCPSCGLPQLGTLFISDNVHTRRCRGCFHIERERLPPLQKKMIYLDQMVLSGIAKELDPVWQEKTRRRDGFWVEAFDRIDRLIKLQLIVCPDSPIHEKESSSDDRYEAVLRRLYEHLASGVALRFPHEVLMAQLAEAFEAWFAGRDPDWTRVTREGVVHGGLDRWNDRTRVSVNMGHWPGQIENRRRSRDRAHEILGRHWKRWRSESQVSFEDRFQAERRGLAVEVLQSYAAYVERWHQVATGAVEIGDPQQLVPGSLVQLVTWVLSRLEEHNVPQEARIREVKRFLYSEPALSAPQNHLTAVLYSGLARRAAHGQKRVPSRGTPNDIDFISAYLPYCDAMFIDKEFDLLLSERPVAPKVEDYPTKIFSTRTRRDFLSYLDALEAEADPDHVDLVVRTYGETRTEPYRSMLEHERSRRTASL